MGRGPQAVYIDPQPAASVLACLERAWALSPRGTRGQAVPECSRLQLSPLNCVNLTFGSTS